MDAREQLAGWRRIHTEAFGKTFALAFSELPEAAIALTAALIRVSRREYAEALPEIEALIPLAVSDRDVASVHYFAGLTHEMSGDAEGAEEHYGAVWSSDTHLSFTPAFHPYYRFAKTAQRAGLCKKAERLYLRALSYYEREREDYRENALAAAVIHLDIGTTLLYSHDYRGALRELDLSRRIYGGEIHGREYVLATLYSVLGDKERARHCVSASGALSQHALAIVEAIESGVEPHYCVGSVSESAIAEAIAQFNGCEGELFRLISGGRELAAEQRLEAIVKTALGERADYPRVRVRFSDGVAAVICYTSYEMSIKYAYGILLPALEREGWRFVTLDEPEEQ